MKKKIPYLILLAATASPAWSQTLTSAILSNADVTIYEESSPGTLVINNSAPLLTVLQGSANAAGGNVELFTSSDGLPNDSTSGGLFGSANPTILTAGFSNSDIIVLSGLSGQDWFTDSSNSYDTSYGANNLANLWFSDFLGAMSSQQTSGPDAITGNEAFLYSNFLSNGGFAQLSDPNISYIENTGSILNIGLGGFADSTSRVAGLIGVSEAQLTASFANGIEVSEVVLINGQAAYGFDGVDSGVVLNDGVNSYASTFVVSVPEPSSALLSLAGLALAARRRR